MTAVPSAPSRPSGARLAQSFGLVRERVRRPVVAHLRGERGDGPVNARRDDPATARRDRTSGEGSATPS